MSNKLTPSAAKERAAVVKYFRKQAKVDAKIADMYSKKGMIDLADIYYRRFTLMDVYAYAIQRGDHCAKK